ncbi:MAG: hypothetical protein GY858_08800 [Candidatus Omnitrophica bacterium]|nr:hypothetical protein [Candidatus Omnitrophota bacterium]
MKLDINWRRKKARTGTISFGEKVIMVYVIREEIRSFVRYTLHSCGTLSFNSKYKKAYLAVEGKKAARFLFSDDLLLLVTKYELPIDVGFLRRFMQQRIKELKDNPGKLRGFMQDNPRIREQLMAFINYQKEDSHNEH